MNREHSAEMLFGRRGQPKFEKPMPRTSVAQKLILLTMVCACVAIVMFKHKRDVARERNTRIDYTPYTIGYSISLDQRTSFAQ